MSREEAIEIINKKRIGSPFTMGLPLDKYIKTFRSRYLKMTNEIIDTDYINIAELILKLDAGK